MAKTTRLKVKKLYPDAQLPTRTHDCDAGSDLYVHRIEDHPNYLKVFSGVAIEPEDGFYYLLFPRSSVYKSGLLQHNSVGVIDTSYRGEVIGVFAKTPGWVMPKVGDRVMQLVAQECINVQIEEASNLSDTARGAGGYGSTGK